MADTLQPADGQSEIPVVVAVHIRPLIHDEVVNGCSPCLSVTEGEPQVRRPRRSAVAHIGSSASLAASVCVATAVDAVCGCTVSCVRCSPSELSSTVSMRVM